MSCQALPTIGEAPAEATLFIAAGAGLEVELYYSSSPVRSAIIAAITRATPGVMTVYDHPFVNGDTLFLSGLVGMPQLNQQRVTVTVVDADHLALNVDTRGYQPYIDGGEVDDSVPINASDYGARLEIRPRPGASPVLTLTESAGITIDGPAGVFLLTLDEAQTLTLNGLGTEATYLFDVIPPGHPRRRLLQGPVEVKRQ